LGRDCEERDHELLVEHDHHQRAQHQKHQAFAPGKIRGEDSLFSSISIAERAGGLTALPVSSVARRRRGKETVLGINMAQRG